MTSREDGPRPETLAAIEVAVGSSLAPVRPIRAVRVALPVAVSAALVATAVVVGLGRGPLWASIVAAVSGVAAAFAVVAMAVRAGVPASGVGRAEIIAVAVGAVVVASGVAALFAPLDFDLSRRVAEEWACFAMTMGGAAIPVAVAAWQLRGIYLWSWRRVVAMAFFGCAIAGAVIAEIVCRSSEGSHIVLTHLMATGVVAAVGAWLGARRRAISPRA